MRSHQYCGNPINMVANPIDIAAIPPISLQSIQYCGNPIKYGRKSKSHRYRFNLINITANPLIIAATPSIHYISTNTVAIPSTSLQAHQHRCNPINVAAIPSIPLQAHLRSAILVRTRTDCPSGWAHNLHEYLGLSQVSFGARG